jgi:hypothetical protein
MEAIFQMWKEPEGGLKLKRGFYMSPFKALGSSLSPLLTLLALWPRKYIHLWPQVSWPKQWNIFSIFLMLHHWLASHEGFSIKCLKVFFESHPLYDETQGSGAFTDNSIVIDCSLFLFWHFDEFSHPNKSWSQEALALGPKRDNAILPLIHRV